MSMDPLASRVAERFYSVFRRAFDTVSVKAASGERTEYEVLKRYGEFVVHAMLGGRGYSVVYAPTGVTVRTTISSRKVADGLAKHLGSGPGNSLWHRAVRGDVEVKTAFDTMVAEFKPVPGPPKRAGSKTPVGGPRFPFEAAADGDHIQKTFRSMDAALRAAIDFRRDHPGDSSTDWLKIERRASEKATPQPLVSLKGATGGWNILASALTDAPAHLVRELLAEGDEE